MGVWDFIQDQVLGMKLLNELLGIGLSARIPEAESLSVSLSAKLFGICSSYDFVERILDNAYGKACGDIIDGCSILLGLLHL